MATDPETRNCALIYLAGKQFYVIFLGKYGFKNGISSKDGIPIPVTNFLETNFWYSYAPKHALFVTIFMFRYDLHIEA